MADLESVVNAVAAAVRAVPSLAGRTYEWGMDELAPPAAIVVPSPDDCVHYNETMDDADVYVVIVKVIVSAAYDRTGQQQLRAYVARDGAESVRAAVLADQRLGGTVSFTHVRVASRFGDVEYAGATHYGVEFPVEVHT